MTRIPPPRARSAAVLVSVLLALLLVALAVVAVRDLAVSQGWTTGSPWSLSLVRDLDGLTDSVWVTATGVVVALVGLVLVWLALKPGARTHLAGRSDSDLWVSPGAVAALARGTADRAPGVVSADVRRVSRRRITVEVVTNRDASSVTGGVEAALRPGPGDLTHARVDIRTKEISR